MSTNIDKAGRFVIPKEFREKLGLTPDSSIEVILDGTDIRIRKAENFASLKKIGRFYVLKTGGFEGESDPVKLIQQSRNERENKFNE
ncbi:MAG: AbrB/MazE/SpoVT family DNA-binding domain-containing protein [Leptospiraceae bacterium]|nr:AbrB/MazE/SpoVT family DNA-binding domain-containing protein [Leptospiraceae bacterium]